MSLSVQLEGKLDATSVISAFTTLLGEHTASVGELDVSIDASVTGDAAQHAADSQPTGFGAALAQIVERMQPLLANLPIAGDALGPVSAALDTFESVATGQLWTDATGALDAIRAEVEGNGDGLPALILRVLDLLGGHSASARVGELIGTIFRLVGAPTLSGPVAHVRDSVAALDGISRVLGGEMNLETVLAEGERLTTLVARQLDQDEVARLVAIADAAVGTDGSLAAFVRSLNPDQAADIAAAAAAIKHARTAIERLVDGLAAGLGLGEATLLYLDVDTMQREVDVALGLVRDADLLPAKRVVADGMAWLAPLLAKIDLEAVPELTLEALLTQLEGAIGQVASGISAIDTAGAVRPLADVLAKVADLTRAVADALDSVVQQVRNAMESIRAVVAALPFEAIADAIRRILEPIQAALDFLKNVVGAIGSTIEDTANAAAGVLREIEQAVDQFIAQVEGFFGGVKRFIDELHIDQVLGQVADNIRAFADLIGRARLQPYFDTAVDAIGTTADVVSALPFDLMPDSMKADVDAAVKPVKDVDIEAFETQVETILQITPEGKFALRDEITTGLASVQARYDELIQTIRDHHPRKYLHDLDLKLSELGGKIRDIEPGLTLGPLRDAIDQIKSALEGFDLAGQLEPVDAVFRQVLDVIDQYNPVQLLRPVEQRLDQLRSQFVETLKIDRWVSALTGLRDQGLARIGALDPSRYAAQIAQLLDGARQALAGLPEGSILGPLGHIVCMLLSGAQLRLHPDSFAAVVRWLRGASASAALDARTQSIGDAVAATHRSVSALDLNAIGARFASATAELRAAVAVHPDGSELRGQLELALSGFDPQGSFLALVLNRSRYLALLEQAKIAAEALRRSGFSLASEGVERLREVFGPTRVFSDMGRTVLGKFGIRDLDRGLRGVVEDVLAVATPARLAALGTPIVTAIRERLRALVDTVLAPVIDGARQVERAVATIDLTPIVDAIQGVVDETKHQIEQLSPLTLLAEPIAAFEGLKAEIAAFDPFGPLLELLDELRATIRRLVGDPPDLATNRVEGKLSAERLLAVPLTIVDDILDAFAALDLNALLVPILDQLDVLAHDVDDGLDRTVTAFKRLQQALPGGGGGSSVSVSISTSVGG